MIYDNGIVCVWFDMIACKVWYNIVWYGVVRYGMIFVLCATVWWATVYDLVFYCLVLFMFGTDLLRLPPTVLSWTSVGIQTGIKSAPGVTPQILNADLRVVPFQSVKMVKIFQQHSSLNDFNDDVSFLSTNTNIAPVLNSWHWLSQRFDRLNKQINVLKESHCVYNQTTDELSLMKVFDN